MKKTRTKYGCGQTFDRHLHIPAIDGRFKRKLSLYKCKFLFFCIF